MNQDSNPPSPFENLDNIITAIGEPGTTEEDRRLFLRAAVRSFELLTGQAHARLGALADALTPKEGK
jgi:hypothetical protein